MQRRARSSGRHSFSIHPCFVVSLNGSSKQALHARSKGTTSHASRRGRTRPGELSPGRNALPCERPWSRLAQVLVQGVDVHPHLPLGAVCIVFDTLTMDARTSDSGSMNAILYVGDRGIRLRSISRKGSAAVTLAVRHMMVKVQGAPGEGSSSW